MKKILFLGYNRDQTSLIDKIQLHKKNWSVKQTEKKIDLNLAQKFFDRNIHSDQLETILTLTINNKLELINNVTKEFYK